MGIGLFMRLKALAPVLAALVLAAILLVATSPTTLSREAVDTSAATCDPTLSNPIVCENELPGSPSSAWAIKGYGDPSIQGFATSISVNQGEIESFKIDTDASAYSIAIYRLGYYGGMGARQVATVQPSATLPQIQPACLNDTTTGLIDCGNWAVSASWMVPTTAVSGIYFAKLTRTDTGGASQIVFIVRDDLSTSDVLFQTSDTTWEAYNNYGGNSLYQGWPVGRAYKVSYNRPFYTAVSKPQTWLFNNEYPMVRWLEANGYDVRYTTGMDSDRIGALIQNHKVFLSVGHDEYWSGNQRSNVEAARAAGVNLAFFSGNEIFWKTRWESSIDGSNAPYRTLVCYKESSANKPIDPDDPPTWTGLWRDGRFSPPADGGRPENALSGVQSTVTGFNNQSLTVPSVDSNLRFWRNTAVASLASGQSVTLTAGCNCVIGYEWDSDVNNGRRPAGLIQLSKTTVSVPVLGTESHELTLYRYGSGALIFGAGTMNWALGLDGHSLVTPSTPEITMQQATVNLLADMGTQPLTLESGLIAASPSTDHLPPTSSIVAPTGGASLVTGAPVTISGTASDVGGVVAAVEVSVDGGNTWQPVGGRANWSYSWTPSVPGSVTILSRAVDDSGNLETPGPGVSVTVLAPTPTSTPTPTPSPTLTPTATATTTGTPSPTGETPTPSVTPTTTLTPTVASASISITPTSGTYGGFPIKVTGTNFGSSEMVALYLDTTASSPIKSISAASDGSFATSFAVPDAPLGAHLVIAIGQSTGAQASATYQMTPRLILSQTLGPPGTTVAVSGYGFRAGETVYLRWGTITGPFIGVATADPLGRFAGSSSANVVIPSNATSGTTYYIYAIGGSSRAWARVQFTVQ